VKAYSCKPKLLGVNITQADAIISRLQIADKEVNDAEPTLLIASDTVCTIFSNRPFV